jgi:hypothetical protein
MFPSLLIAMLLLLAPDSLLASKSSELPSRHYLEKLQTDQKAFKNSVEELLKITYAEKDWSSFFSYAQYYRVHWPAAQRSDVFLLELLALLRHCQNELLTELIEDYRRKLTRIPPELSQLEALSKTHFKGKASEQQTAHGLSQHFKGHSLWKADQDLVGQVHPSRIKIRLENRCEPS